MSMKQELETWVSALSHFDSNRYEEAIAAFQPIADTSKILFNCGVIRASIGDHDTAVQYFEKAVELDQYLAIAYFQQGVSNFILGCFEEALSNFDDALLYLRGNKCIDYEQLGLKFKLHSCEALFNRGLCYIYIQDHAAGMRDLSFAAGEKAKPDHDVIDEAIKDNAVDYTVFSIPAGVLFRPSEAKVRNIATRNYLGDAKVVRNKPDATEVVHLRRGFAVKQWGADERSPDSISYAATHLVRSETTHRARQQSEPPMHRSPYFPPTPPPEAEKPTFARQQRPSSPEGTAESNRSQSLNRRPPRLELGIAALESPHTRRNTPVLKVTIDSIPTTTIEPAYDRPRPRRTASERPAARMPEQSRLSVASTITPDSRPASRQDFSPVDRHDSSRSRPNTLSPDSEQKRFWKTSVGGKHLKLQRPASIEEVDENNGFGYVPKSTDTSPASGNPGSADADVTNGLSWYLSRRLSMASSTNTLTASGTVRLKAHYGKDIRYLTLQSSITFEEFQAHIVKKFGKGSLRIQMRDEDGDMITMADQEDLDTAIAMSLDQSGKDARTVGKLELWLQDL